MWIDDAGLNDRLLQQDTIFYLPKGYVLLLLAIVAEVAGTCCMKMSSYPAYRIYAIPAYAFYAFSFSLFP